MVDLYYEGIKEWLLNQKRYREYLKERYDIEVRKN